MAEPDTTHITRRKVVTPKVNAYMYRARKAVGALTNVDAGTISGRKGTISKIVMEDVSDMRASQNRIKGIEHEQTALFGGVLDLNMATDPHNRIFDTFMPDDHIEVFYEDVAKPDSKARFPLPQSFGMDTTDAGVPETDPKFAGVVWKEELIEKPSQVTTKVKAWDYHRMMQYMNIPRGESGRTSVSYLNFDPYMVERDEITQLIPTKVPSSGTPMNVSPHNDLLDYIDHVVQLYFKHGHEEDSVFFFPKVDESGSASNQRVLSVKKNPLDLKAFTLSGLDWATASPVIKSEAMWDDYPLLKKLKIGEQVDGSIDFNSETAADAMIKIANSVSGTNKMSITRFMDTTVEVTTGFENTDVVDPEDPEKKLVRPAPGARFRVVGEIISIDQFALAHLLAAGMAYDYGISEWFTPVPIFSASYKQAMEEMISEASDVELGVKPTSSRLTYVRWFAGRRDTGMAPRSVKLKRIAAFNIDSYGNLAHYFSEMVKINLQTITMFKIEGADLTGSARFMYEPYFLPIVLASVRFPQRNTKYVFYRGTSSETSGYRYHDMIDRLGEFAEIDLSGSTGKSFRMLMTYHLRNVTSWTGLMNKAFMLDDKLISFMTNIPSAYMRADIYTGSRFKTYAYDSLSIIRVLQILSSSMRGFPATNNPVHTGQQAVPEGAKEKVQKVDHYPIFMANRIVVSSSVLWVPKDNIKPGVGDVLREYSGTTSVSASFKDGRIREAGVLFVLLTVDFKKQVYDMNEVNFKIPVGDVNDLSMVKGASVNHYLNLSFVDHGHYIDSNDVDGTLSKSMIALAFNLGGRMQRTVSPAEFSPLTLTDMTQSAAYDPIISRTTCNTNIGPKDRSGGFPVYHPGVAYTLLPTTGAHLFYQGNYMVSDFAKRTTNKVLGLEIRELHKTLDVSRYPKEVLASVTKYVNFTDLINELKLLIKLEDPTKVTAAYMGIEDGENSLFKNIRIISPYKVFRSYDDTTGVESYKLIPNEDKKDRSFSEFLDDIEASGILDLIEIDMAWMAPIAGHVLVYDKLKVLEFANAYLFGAAWPIEKSYDKHGNAGCFDDYKPMYMVISYLDLIVKGLRYLLWNISKSRFTGHVYLPMTPPAKPGSGYTQFASLGDPIGPGSSVVFELEDDNVRAKTIHARSTFELYASSEKPIIEGRGQHQLQTMITGDDPVALIWYVSKKIVYIGEDSGAMMRLLMTEGSFDWTVFYREDTQMTRMSEYFLMNGMGNFFLGRGGV